MRRINIILIFMCMALLGNAIPAYNEWQVFRQNDGSTLRLQLMGDEWFHYYITDDHVPVIQIEGTFYYAKIQHNKLVSTGIVAHEKEYRTSIEKNAITDIETVEKIRSSRCKATRRYINPKKQLSYIGEKKGLIILVDFPDRKFHDDDGTGDSMLTRQRYENLANQTGYTNDMGAIGSVHDYFLEQSYGQFDLSFDIVGPVTMPESYTYYGMDLGEHGLDLHVPEMLVEICNMVDEDIDFSQYDWNDDGKVDQVFLLYAGYGQATGGPWNTIWPHMWSLSEAKEEEGVLDGPVSYDGVAVDVYACSNELYGKQGAVEMGIGTICHEFSHCLGLPDLYDVNSSSNFTLGNWDLLAKGNYNGPTSAGWVPPAYSAYERWFAGWLEPITLNNDTTVIDMSPLTVQPVAYVIYNDGYPDEYYLLEHRTQSRWDSYLPGQGLLISHIDYDEQLWNDNLVNTVGSMNDHLRLAFFHADGLNQAANTAYPYENNDSLTDTSLPAATLFHANTDGSFYMHKPVDQISYDSEKALASFRFENKNSPVSSVIMTENGHKTIRHISTIEGKEIPTEQLMRRHEGVYIIQFNDGTVVKKQVK